jgi:hypothetical protein
MPTSETIALALAAIGCIGVCLMVAAFALIGWRGGWEVAITKPGAEKRWPAQRWMMLAGATCGLVAGLGWVLLSLTMR